MSKAKSANDFEVPPPNADLTPCRVCGRTFAPSTLVKHEPICKNATTKKRKVFDSGKMRAMGTEIPVNKTMRPGQKPKPEKPKPSHWRQEHEEFIATIRAAKTGTAPPPSSIPADYVHCPYCDRNFSQTAAERHIEFCKSQAMKKGGAPKLADKKPKQAPSQIGKPQQKRVNNPAVSTSKTAVNISKTTSHNATNKSTQNVNSKPSAVTLKSNSRVVNAHSNSTKSYQPPPPKTKSGTGAGPAKKPAGPTKPINRSNNNNNAGNSSDGPKLQARAPGAPARNMKASNSTNNKQSSSKSAPKPKSKQTPIANNTHANHEPLHDPFNDDPFAGAQEMQFTRPSSERNLTIPRKQSEESGYYSGQYSPTIYPSSYSNKPGAGQRSQLPRLSRPGSSTLCPECGGKYPSPHAKFCVECGVKRASLT